MLVAVIGVWAMLLAWGSLHSVLSFFFDGLIVVLALTTILSVGSV